MNNARIHTDDWRCDQYRWQNQGVRKLPKKAPAIKKSYFQVDTPKGASADFTKHAYQLLDPDKRVTLIQYLGDEKVAVKFAHGNTTRNQEQTYVRTCPSVLKNLENRCANEGTSKVYKSEITKLPPASHIPVLQPRNSKQVENIRLKQLQKRRLSHDALYNLHEMATDLPNFVHTIHTHPDLVCVLGQRAVLEELDRVLLLDTPSPQLLSYDTTFQLGDFYISILCFRHTLFKEAPIIPAAFLLHERKFQSHHAELFSICRKLIKSLRSSTHPIVTDEEQAIVNAISETLPQVPQLRCWNHIFKDVTRWLRSHGAPSDDVSIYQSDVRALFHLPTEEEYTSTLAEMKCKWSAPFFDYYTRNIHPDIHSIGRWAIESYRVYDPYSGVTNNQSESLNFVLKQLQEWRESPLDCMVLALYYLQSYYLVEVIRGQHGLGKYHLHSQYCGRVNAQPLPDGAIYSPDEIVQRIKGNLCKPTEGNTAETRPEREVPKKQLSQRERAQRLIDEKKISFDPNLHTFTLLGAEDRPQVVKLFPKETCTCPSTTQCYHILAAKLCIGQGEGNKPKKLNLTQLRRNARSRREKSGRKNPRPGDSDVMPAPDAEEKDASNTGK